MSSLKYDGWLEKAKQYAEHLRSVAGNKEDTDDDETHMWKLYVKLKRYQRVPQFLDKDGDLFVARCEDCEKDKNRKKRYKYQQVCRRCTRFENFAPEVANSPCLKTQDGEICRPQKRHRLYGVSPCERCEKFEKVSCAFPPDFPEKGKYAVTLKVKCTQCEAESVLVRCPKGELLELPSFYLPPKSPAAEEKERKAAESYKCTLDPKIAAELDEIENYFKNYKVRFSAERLEEANRRVLSNIEMDEDVLTTDSEDDCRYWD